MKKFIGCAGVTVFLIVGLAFSYALWSGMIDLATAIRHQTFSSSSSSYPEPLHAVVKLSGDRFAIVTDNNISTYQVNGQGRIIRTDDVETYYKQIQPMRRPTPRPTPEPGASNSSVGREAGPNTSRSVIVTSPAGTPTPLAPTVTASTPPSPTPMRPPAGASSLP